MEVIIKKKKTILTKMYKEEVFGESYDHLYREGTRLTNEEK